MSEPYIAEIRIFAGTFPPRGWAFCDGQLLSIASNTALFSLIGTIYGGNGETNFALPDLRGRVPLHAGNGSGPGLSPYNEGQRAGVETTTHAVSTSVAQYDQPHSHELVGGSAGSGVPSTTVATVETTSGVSSSAPTTDNRQPYLAVNFIIALQGVYPSES